MKSTGRYYCRFIKTDYDAWNTFLLLDTAKALDYAEMDNKDIRTICDFTISCREWDSRARQMNSLQLYYKMAQDGVSYQCLSSYINQCFLLERETDCIQLVFLRDRLASASGTAKKWYFCSPVHCRQGRRTAFQNVS